MVELKFNLNPESYGNFWSLNRTMVELKFGNGFEHFCRSSSLNRTMVELKFEKAVSISSGFSIS